MPPTITTTTVQNTASSRIRVSCQVSCRGPINIRAESLLIAAGCHVMCSSHGDRMKGHGDAVPVPVCSRSRSRPAAPAPASASSGNAERVVLTWVCDTCPHQRPSGFNHGARATGFSRLLTHGCTHSSSWLLRKFLKTLVNTQCHCVLVYQTCVSNVAKSFAEHAACRARKNHNQVTPTLNPQKHASPGGRGLGGQHARLVEDRALPGVGV